jgi:predicted RNA polymerase sigma factor
MNDTAVTAAAKAVLIDCYLDVKVQLERGTGTRPVLWLLAQARARAVDSIRKLIEIDASETEAIRSLQAEVRLYGDMVESCRDLVARGKEADREIDDEAREEIAEIIETSDEARSMGLAPATED